MATLSKNPFVSPGYDPNIWTPENWAKEKKITEDLEKKSASIDYNDPNCDLTGAVVYFGVGDGYAVYVVTKNKPLTLSHVPYGDAWWVPYVTIRGVNRNYVRSFLRQQAEAKRIFAER